MSFRSILTFLSILFFATFSLPICDIHAQPSLPSSSGLDATSSDAQKEEGESKSPSGIDFRWKEGLYLGYHYRDILNVELGGLLSVDGGYIDANQALENAYPTLEGWSAILRTAKIKLVATFYKTIEFKMEYDFTYQEKSSSHPKFNDFWIGSKKKIPFFGYITVGNMKEPFSLEELASSDTITFMERSLPTKAFSPSYNFGSRLNNTAFDERITWAVGIYANTQDLNNVSSTGGIKNQFSTANGYSLAARVTGLPWYEEGGKRLLHVGVSYNFRARDVNKDGAEEKFSTRPESYLTDDKLVNTGNLAATRSNLISGELAWVWGPFSLQGEYFHAFTNGEGNPNFWGYYIYGSFFLTGEHRSYDTPNGVFTSIKPKQCFNPFRGGWGAWEVVARYSRINLNSHSINGGKEGNVTLGLNWYLHRNLRLMFNYIRVNVNNATVENGRANIFQSRFQIAF